MNVIHWHRVAGDTNPHSIRASIHKGEVSDIADRMMSKIRSQGHEVNPAGYDATGPDGAYRELFFTVTVDLEDGSEPTTWLHGVITPEQPWGLTTAASDDARREGTR